VEHVLEVPELDVFDGIVVKTPGGLRFANADQVADITDRYVVLNLPVEDTEWLGGPQAPAVYHADPSEHAGGSLHDWFGRRFGRPSLEPGTLATAYPPAATDAADALLLVAYGAVSGRLRSTPVRPGHGVRGPRPAGRQPGPGQGASCPDPAWSALSR
jgi:hypothetical protein